MLVADFRPISFGASGEIAKYGPQAEAAYRRVKQGCVEIDGVVVAAALLPEVNHVALAQLAHDTPDRTLCEVKVAGDFFDRRIRANGYVQEYPAVRGEYRKRTTIPAVEIRAALSRLLYGDFFAFTYCESHNIHKAIGSPLALSFQPAPDA